MPSQNSQEKAAPAFLPALTGLRWIAAFHVVAYHFWPIDRSATILGRIVGLGYVGVSLFFVLSGFILAHSYSNRASAFQPKKFLLARFARIYPVYALSLLIMLPPIVREGIFVNGAQSPLQEGASFMSRVFMLHAWVPAWVAGINLPSWSLSVEAFFYVVFAGVYKKLSAASNKFLWAGMGALCAFSLILPSFFWRLHGPGDEQDWSLFMVILKFNPIVRLPEFLIGVALGILHFRGLAIRSHSWANGFATLSLAITFLLTVWPLRTPYVLIHSGLMIAPFAVLIMSLADGKGLLGWILSKPLLVLLGNSSYAVYILHEPLHRWFEVTAERLGYASMMGRWTPSIFMVFIALAAIVVFRFYEEPARRMLRMR